MRFHFEKSISAFDASRFAGLTRRGRKPKLNLAAIETGCRRKDPMISYNWQYIPLLLQILAAFGLGIGMAVGSYFIGRHRNTITKLDTYECGIASVGDARGRFSVRFYLVAMLFILFDVEVVFMMPWAVVYRQLPAITGSKFFGFWEMVVYLGFVAVGLFYIVKKGILDWSKDKGDL